MGRTLEHEVVIREVAKALGLTVIGDKDLHIKNVASVDKAIGGTLCFAKNCEWAAIAHPDSVLLTSPKFRAKRTGPVLLSSQPRLDFARMLAFLESTVGFIWSDTAPHIHETAKIGNNVVIGNGVRIGANTVVRNNVVIGPEVEIGENCVIKSGAVIGEEGFGFERDELGRAIRLPHIGSVIIEDQVEIGSLTTVCRGTLGNTILRNRCKIDDHVHIAHNVDVGEDAFVIACAEISGGVRIGARAWIAPGVSVMNQLSIGEDAIVGLGGVVIKSVSDNTTVVGNPAKVLSK